MSVKQALPVASLYIAKWGDEHPRGEEGLATEAASRATPVLFRLRRDATVAATEDESGLLREDLGLRGEPAVARAWLTPLLPRGLLCGEERRLAMKGSAP